MILSIKNSARFWGLSLHMAMAIAVSSFLLDRLQAADESQDGVIASIDYHNSGDLYSASSSASQAGYTVATLPTDNAGKTRILVSTAMLKGEFDLSEYRLAAIVKNGKTIEQTRGSTASATGANQQIAVLTLMAEFPTFRGNIEQLLIQRRRPVKVASDAPNSTQVVARKGTKPGQTITRWGSIADPDGDCQALANDDKLAVTIPARSHDLHPLAGNNAPSALNRVGGDFTFQVKVTGEFQPGPKSQTRGAPFNGAGILVWENERNYLRIERNAYWASETNLVCHLPLIEYWNQYRERSANTKQVSADEFQGQSTWLKVRRQGKTFTISISHDAENWREIKSVSCDMSDEVYVGVAAINTSNKSFTVEFSEHQLLADRQLQNEPEPEPQPVSTAVIGDFMMDISNRQVTNADLYRLCNDSELTILKAAYSTITDEGLREVVRAKKLKVLDLSETQITEGGLKELSRLKNLSMLQLAGLTVTDAGVKELGNLAELSSINLSKTQVTDAGLEELVQFKKLTSLDLGGTAVTDAGLVALARQSQITELGLASTRVTDTGLAHLAFLNNLSKLELSRTSVTDGGLKSLAGLKRLKELNLSMTSITDEGLQELASLSTLTTLYLSQTRITDRGLASLSRIPSLTTLELANLSITDSGVKNFVSLKRLAVLNLEGTSVTDVGLKSLATLSGLRKLFVRKNHLSETALDELQLSLPKCEIQRE